MATGGGGGSPYGDGGGAGGGAADGDGGACSGGGPRCPFDKVGVHLDSGDELEVMDLSSAGGQKGAPEEGSSQVAAASQCSTDPLSHYLPDYG